MPGIEPFINFASALRPYAAVACVLIVAFTGLRLMFSWGNPQARANALSGLVWSAIGLFLAASPFMIVNIFGYLMGTGTNIDAPPAVAGVDPTQLEPPTIVAVELDNDEWRFSFSEPITCDGTIYIKASNVTSAESEDCDGDETRILSFCFEDDADVAPEPEGFIEKFVMTGSTKVRDQDGNSAIMAFRRERVPDNDPGLCS